MAAQLARRSGRLILWALLAVAPAWGGTVGLAWTPVGGAGGYRIYYGIAPGEYTGVLDAGAATEATLTGLADCTEYHMAVKAYNGLGESPEFSNEISGWSRPEVGNPQPAGDLQGTTRSFELHGANFRPGASVHIENPNVHVESALWLDCGRMQVEVSIDPSGPGARPAEVGRFRVTVENSDGTFGERTSAFEVQVNPQRFDVNRSVESTRGRLDGADTVWLARLFSSREGRDALYDPDFDLNGDGWVDGQDLAYVAGHLGQCWSGNAWSVEACPEAAQ